MRERPWCQTKDQFFKKSWRHFGQVPTHSEAFLNQANAPPFCRDPSWPAWAPGGGHNHRAACGRSEHGHLSFPTTPAQPGSEARAGQPSQHPPHWGCGHRPAATEAEARKSSLGRASRRPSHRRRTPPAPARTHGGSPPSPSSRAPTGGRLYAAPRLPGCKRNNAPSMPP